MNSQRMSYDIPKGVLMAYANSKCLDLSAHLCSLIRTCSHTPHMDIEESINQYDSLVFENTLRNRFA